MEEGQGEDPDGASGEELREFRLTTSCAWCIWGVWGRVSCWGAGWEGQQGANEAVAERAETRHRESRRAPQAT
jgi:hypothetical protein